MSKQDPEVKPNTSRKRRRNQNQNQQQLVPQVRQIEQRGQGEPAQQNSGVPLPVTVSPLLTTLSPTAGLIYQSLLTTLSLIQKEQHSLSYSELLRCTETNNLVTTALAGALNQKYFPSAPPFSFSSTSSSSSSSASLREESFPLVLSFSDSSSSFSVSSSALCHSFSSAVTPVTQEMPFDEKRLDSLIGEIVSAIKQSDMKGPRKTLRQNIAEFLNTMKKTVETGIAEFKNHPKAIAKFLTCNTGIRPFTPLLLVLLRYTEALELASIIVKQMLEEKIRSIPPVPEHLKSALVYLSGRDVKLAGKGVTNKGVTSHLPALLNQLTSWRYEDPAISVKLYGGPGRSKMGEINSHDFIQFLLRNLIEKLYPAPGYSSLLSQVCDRVIQKTTFKELFEYIKTIFNIQVSRGDAKLTFQYNDKMFQILENTKDKDMFWIYDPFSKSLNKITEKHLDLLRFLFSTDQKNRDLFLNFLASTFEYKIEDNKPEELTIKNIKINYGTILFILLTLWSRTHVYEKIRPLIKEIIPYVNFSAECYQAINYSLPDFNRGYCSILNYLRNNPVGIAIFFDIMSKEDPLQAQIFLTQPGYQNLSLLDWAIHSHTTLSRCSIQKAKAVSKKTERDRPLLEDFQTGFELMVLFGEEAYLRPEKDQKALMQHTELPAVLITVVLGYLHSGAAAGYQPDFKSIKTAMASAKGTDLVNHMTLFRTPLESTTEDIFVSGSSLNTLIPQII